MLGWEEYLCLVERNICAWLGGIFVLGRDEYLCLDGRNICAWLRGIFVLGWEEYLCFVERNICAWSRGIFVLGREEECKTIKVMSSNQATLIFPSNRADQGRRKMETNK